MALGIAGTGPYGRIRSLQQEISGCKYELELIAQGMRRKRSPKKLREIIANNRAEIRKIKIAEKAKK